MNKWKVDPPLPLGSHQGNFLCVGGFSGVPSWVLWRAEAASHRSGGVALACSLTTLSGWDTQAVIINTPHLSLEELCAPLGITFHCTLSPVFKSSSFLQLPSVFLHGFIFFILFFMFWLFNLSPSESFPSPHILTIYLFIALSSLHLEFCQRIHTLKIKKNKKTQYL